MSVNRVLAVWTLVVVAAAGLPAQDLRETAGPLEQQANPITPENPIPRRTYSIAPAYPAEARGIDAAATVSLRVTVNELGRVAEIRKVNDPLVTLPAGTRPDPTAVRRASDALLQAAVTAVRQWQYDAPARAPISFPVTASFRPGVEPAMVQDAAPPRMMETVTVRAGNTAAAAPLGGVPPLRVGSGVSAPMQTRKVNPAYPPIAENARVQGVVILEAVIGTDGRVADARVLRSIPLLDQAAIDAVRQWEYQPTLLNGAPIPIIMTVTVQFALAEPGK
jgi:TonB family protein